MTRTIDFMVTGERKIHCAGCELRIETALRQLPGIRNVQASAETQRVVVRSDPAQVGAEGIRAKLEELGYQAEFVKESSS